MSSGYDWNSLRMVTPGTVPPAAWNAMLDLIQGATVQNVIGGRVRSWIPGVGTDLEVDVTAAQIAAAAAWPFKIYDASTAAGGAMVRVNGGDGFVAQLNGTKLQVEGQDNDTTSGMPPSYPTLTGITGNGWVYAKAVIDTPGDISTLDDFDLLFAADLPDQDSSAPAGFCIIPLATIGGYTAGVGGAAPTFSVNNVTNYGFTTLFYCGNALGVW